MSVSIIVTKFTNITQKIIYQDISIILVDTA